MWTWTSYTQYSLHILLVGVFLWPGWQCFTQPIIKQEVVLQIITQFDSSSEHVYDNAHLLSKETINKGRELAYKHLREHFEINSWLNFTETASPAEILSLYCTGIFTKHVNTLTVIKHAMATPASYNYIMQLARHLGYPVISWDPNYPGALQSVEDSRVLQIAPTIYHQCQAMSLLLSRYNWTSFSIVTSKISSHDDFISCMTDMVKRTSVRQGYSTTHKFRILSTITIDVNDYDDYDVTEAKIRTELQPLIRTVTRVVLLHAGSSHAKDILEVAADMELTGQKYIWLLTSNSIGGIFGTHPRASRAYPIGTIGISYNDTQEKIAETITTSLRIWALGLEKLAQKPDVLRRLIMYPRNTCNSTRQDFWRDGEHLYRAMKSVELTNPPVKFTDNGVIEKVALQIYNVRPMPTSKSRRPSSRRTSNTWAQVGNILPVKVGRNFEMKIEMDEIVWPGQAVSPPRGRPEKRFFRIATLEELPYIIYEPPDEVTRKCGLHAVPCTVFEHNNPDLKGNYTVNSRGEVDYCCTGLCVDLLEILSKRMNFDFEMYEVEDGQWGMEKDNGEWTGLPNEMRLSKADMVITSIKINQQRAMAMDFSTPFLETGITILVALRKGAISATAFLEPFDMYSWVLVMLLCIPTVASAIFTTEWFSPAGLGMGNTLQEPYDYPSWCLILVFSVHATGASIFIFEWLSPSGLDKGKTSLREHKFSLFRSFWLIWAMLFGASVSTDNPRGMSSRFLANVWALFALVFLASYTANLAAFMITIDEYFDLSGIQDWRLMNPTAVTPNFRFATVPGGSTEDNIKKNYPRMHRYMQKYNKSDVEEGIITLKRGEIHAFIYDATVLEYNAGRDKDCALLTVGKWYAMTGYGVGFPKGSPHIDEVNTILLELQINGELERLQKFWLAGACHARKDKKDKSSHNIGILNFTSAFILLAGGVLLGTILLLLEHCYFKFGRKCLKKYDRCGCCSLVSLSMGKSLTFEQSVIDAIDFHKRHRCRDPLCETQLWKARHKLDMALLKIERLREELNALEGVDDIDGNTVLAIEHKPTELNGTSHSQFPDDVIDLDSDIPDTVKKRARCQNHIGNSEPASWETPFIDRDPGDSRGGHSLKSAGLSNNSSLKCNNISDLSELDKRRLQFRRSPSYTNAISTDSDGNPSKECKEGGKEGLTKSQSANSNRLEDVSPKRCPSYSQAVEQSSIIDRLDRSTTDSPKQTLRTRYNDGKYYVGVAGDNDESAL